MQRYNAIICTRLANFSANFIHFIHHQFYTLHQSPKPDTRLPEQFHLACIDPLWLNDPIKFLIKKKNVFTQKYLKDERTNANYTILQASQAELTHSINLSKNKHFKRLGDKLKVGLSPSKKIIFVCFNRSPLKMMKNACYFFFEALFVLKIFNFLC